MTDSRPSVRGVATAAQFWMNGSNWWCDVILSSIHFISTFHTVQTCLLWLADRRMHVDCCQYSTRHHIMPPNLATAFAIVGLRHAMWCPRKAGVRPLARGSLGHMARRGRQSVGAGRRRALRVDKRNRAGGSAAFWPTMLTNTISHTLPRRDVPSVSTCCNDHSNQPLPRPSTKKTSRAGQRLWRTDVLVEISEALRRSRAYYCPCNTDLC